MISYSIKELEVGKTYWESTSSGNVEFKVISAPQLINEQHNTWKCRVQSFYEEYDMADSIFFHLSISDEPKYIRVRTIHLDGRIDFNDGDFLNKRGKGYVKQTTSRNEESE